jgi:hypothetical protein
MVCVGVIPRRNIRREVVSGYNIRIGVSIMFRGHPCMCVCSFPPEIPMGPGALREIPIPGFWGCFGRVVSIVRPSARRSEARVRFQRARSLGTIP